MSEHDKRLARAYAAAYAEGERRGLTRATVRALLDAADVHAHLALRHGLGVAWRLAEVLPPRGRVSQYEQPLRGLIERAYTIGLSQGRVRVVVLTEMAAKHARVVSGAWDDGLMGVEG